MAGVEFEEEQRLANTASSVPRRSVPGMAGWVVERHLAPDERSANLVLGIVSALALLAALVIPFLAFYRPNPPQTPDRNALYLHMPNRLQP